MRCTFPAVMHAKAVILDSETVVMGSANWSEAAFQKNTEAGGLIRSREYAGIVFKDCDAIAVEKLIGLEEKYGIDKMEKASKIMSAIHVDNPRRSLEYYFGILRKLE